MERLAKMLKEELRTRRMSIRQLANELHMSHATLTRVLAAYPVDMDTMLTLCDWLGVSLYDVLDQNPKDADLAKRLAIIINREPKLGEVFARALQEVEEDRMDADDLRDIIEYANYKLDHYLNRRRNDERVTEPES